MAQRLNLILSKMDNKQIEILKRSLERQKQARKQAEKILEEKSKELYDTTLRLKETNSRLEELLTEKTSELEGVFINIIDPYIVFDLKGNFIKMNEAAINMLGYDYKKEGINLKSIVHEEYLEYTDQILEQLITVGIIKNFRARVLTKENLKKSIQLNASIIYDKKKNPIAAQGIMRDITQEEGIKKLLAEKRTQLDIIVNNSPLGIVLTDKGKIIRANIAIQNLLGYSEREFKALMVQEISLPDDVDESLKLMEQMNAGEIDQFSIVKHYIKKNGDVLLARTSVSAVKTAKGTVDYQVAIIEDITQQRKIEEQIIASESRLSNLISNLHLGVLLEDDNGKVALTNQIFCDMLDCGLEPDDLIGNTCDGLLNRYKKVFKDPEDFLLNTNNIIQNKKAVLSETIELTENRVYERDFVPIYTHNGYSGHMWIYNDISIQANYKRNLEIQKEKYSSIIANMNLGLIEVDLEDHIQLVNSSFCQMSGYSEEELLGRKGVDILQVQDKDLLANKSQSRLHHISDSYEIQVKNKNGEKRYWLISGAPRYDEGGKVIGTIGIHLDITLKKQLELQKEQLLKTLEERNTSLEEYAHIVSHDLKSPLRSLSALVTWLDEDYREQLDENGVNNLKLMQDKIEGMDKLINGILQYSSIQSDRLEKVQVDINKVVAEISEMMYLPEHVKIVVPTPLPKIIADTTKIHQLFQNIMSNAAVNIDKPEGVIEISSREDDTYWTFRIKDNGIGIPEEYHNKIFDIFQSIGNNERSTGIGLSIVKKIVELYQGQICLDSKVGEGTDFYFTIKKES